MSIKQGRRIAIVGGSGQLGEPIVKALLLGGNHSITAITRTDSTSTFPVEVNVTRGDYKDQKFLEQSLSGQQVLICALGLTADPTLQSSLIRAAAVNRVAWILPCDFGSDFTNEELLSQVQPLMRAKFRYREEIERLAVSAWLSIVNNPWFEMSLKSGNFGIHITERRARLYGNGDVKANTSTLATVGSAVAGLLSLPDHKLERFRNKPAYVSSFRVSQRDILQAVLRVTNTSEDDWTIESVDVDQIREEARKNITSGGGMSAIVDLMYGTVFCQGSGGDYTDTKPLVNQLLELEQEDLDAVVKSIVDHE